MTIPLDEEYWDNYAHLATCSLVRAVQLAEPTEIDGKMHESMDWAVNRSGCYIGVRNEVFEREYLIVPKRNNGEKFDKDQRMVQTMQTVLDRMDDLIAEVSELRHAMCRHGMINDGSQK